jgi:hypothetical protein
MKYDEAYQPECINLVIGPRILKPLNAENSPNPSLNGVLWGALATRSVFGPYYGPSIQSSESRSTSIVGNQYNGGRRIMSLMAAPYEQKIQYFKRREMEEGH